MQMLPCKQLAAVSCAEGAHVRRRRRYGPASDAEFLRSIADNTPGRGDDGGARHMRHVYLKSYSLQLADDDDDGGASKKKKTIVDKTRRAVARAVSKCRNKPARRAHGHGSGSSAAAAASSSQPRPSDAYGCRKAAKRVVSLLLSGLRACTGKPPSSS